MNTGPAGGPQSDLSSPAFAAVNLAFGSLGRACLALDADLRIVHASALIDTIGGPGTAAGLRGTPLEALLGADLFGRDGLLRQALARGERREGWRALLTTRGGERLVSVSACPLLAGSGALCGPEVAFLVVLRPAEEEAPEEGTSLAGFGLTGRSRAMTQVARLVEMLQQSEATVLIEGESGTGKEVLARVIHEQSPRRNGPFVAVAPAALPAELLESELFGHVRGAFTGAVRDRVGRFEAATEGTLFLDELGELPAHLQVKLLRVLQDRSFERVGDSTPRRSDARIIAATNRNLRHEIAAGRFREDLYYRLRVVPVEVPPLRARREDIEPIARLLLSRAGARTRRALMLSPEALRVLLSYRWPGNVRELENALEFATIVCRGQTIQPEDLPPEVLRGAGAPSEEAAATPAGAPSRDEAPPAAAGVAVGEPSAAREELALALQRHGWKREETARELGISRSTLWRRMQRLGLE